MEERIPAPNRSGALAELDSFAAYVVRNLPGEIGMRMRSIYYSSRLGKCGTDPRINESVFFDNPQGIYLGDRVRINRFCMFQGSHGIEIGDDVLIGPYTMLLTEDHIHTNRELPISCQGSSGSRIVVGNGAWIGMGVSVMPGVLIGKNAILGAGAVVTKNVEPFEIVAGIPARRIGNWG